MICCQFIYSKFFFLGDERTAFLSPDFVFFIFSLYLRNFLYFGIDPNLAFSYFLIFSLSPFDSEIRHYLPPCLWTNGKTCALEGNEALVKFLQNEKKKKKKMFACSVHSTPHTSHNVMCLFLSYFFTFSFFFSLGSMRYL